MQVLKKVAKPLRWITDADSLSKGGIAIGGIAVITLSVLVAYSAISRYAFDRPVHFAAEVTGFLLMMSLSLGWSYYFVRGRHIRLTFIRDRLPPKVRKCFIFLNDLVLFLYIGVFLREAISFTVSTFQLGSRTETADIYLPPWLVLFCLSVILFELVILRAIYDNSLGSKGRRMG